MSNETLEQRAVRLLESAHAAAQDDDFETANELTLVALDAVRQVLANEPTPSGSDA